ncbi:MAG: pyruvate kinase [Endomicrobium sp.]|nr:pyruvate kinase [Endomicrobium sp.]
MKKIGIVCTMGPAIRTLEILKNLAESGMTIVRLNFSHGTFAEYEKDIALVRTLNEQYKKDIKILADLEGHRIRVGKIEGGKVELKKGQQLILTNKDVVGNNEKISIDYLNPLTDITKDLTIFIDDGNLVLKVLSSKEDELVTEVQMDYVLKTHKGVNIPDAKLRFKSLEDKDRKGMLFALGQKVDYIANSFVRDAADMQPIIDIIEEQNSKCKLVAKIEDMSGVNNIDEILDVVDGIMVARGDMGVSLPVFSVPIMQKYIIKKVKSRGNKFVITATQMLESMIKNPVPTRAEVSDVANAVLDGTDYTMLSAETSVGHYPEKAVAMMGNVIKYTLENKSKIS